ncbi:MAG: hypothetical protein CAPSK01_000888 [Candidatus Accumulibacter vicinus]|uniref:Uncharacterized protein n=1 Tax=Candidatus Accumulibacter vicinus TaxID=2954382 RepID=A0A084Y3X0_9PROT|nr:MAG: hypothetical protein CAPSK01_000888 [Candidatus Accumulibacter vicinus]
MSQMTWLCTVQHHPRHPDSTTSLTARIPDTYDR